MAAAAVVQEQVESEVEAAAPKVPRIFEEIRYSPLVTSLAIETVKDDETGEEFQVGELFAVVPGKTIRISLGPDAISQIKDEVNGGIEVFKTIPA